MQRLAFPGVVAKNLDLAARSGPDPFHLVDQETDGAFRRPGGDLLARSVGQHEHPPVLPFADVVVDRPEHPQGPVGKQRRFVSVFLPEGFPDPAERPRGFRVIEPLNRLELRARWPGPDRNVPQYRERRRRNGEPGAVTAAVQRAHAHRVRLDFDGCNLLSQPHFPRQLRSHGQGQGNGPAGNVLRPVFQGLAVVAQCAGKPFLERTAGLLLEQAQRGNAVKVGLVPRQPDAAFRHAVARKQVMNGNVIAPETRVQPVVQFLQRIESGQHGRSELNGGDFTLLADRPVVRRVGPFRPLYERAVEVIGERQYRPVLVEGRKLEAIDRVPDAGVRRTHLRCSKLDRHFARVRDPLFLGGPHTAADAVAAFEHQNVCTGLAEYPGGVQPRQTGSDHDDVGRFASPGAARMYERRGGGQRRQSDGRTERAAANQIFRRSGTHPRRLG